LPRARWAALRDGLTEENADTLAAIATAAFILCVEGETPPSNEARMSGWLLPRANRWFDKTLQMVVSPDAMIGCVIEHSSVDGLTVARLGWHIDHFLQAREARAGLPDRRKSTPRPLAWEIDEAAAGALHEAGAAAADLGRTFGLRCIELRDCHMSVKG